jgi:hypothetical protein
VGADEEELAGERVVRCRRRPLLAVDDVVAVGGREDGVAVRMINAGAPPRRGDVVVRAGDGVEETVVDLGFSFDAAAAEVDEDVAEEDSVTRHQGIIATVVAVVVRAGDEDGGGESETTVAGAERRRLQPRHEDLPAAGARLRRRAVQEQAEQKGAVCLRPKSAEEVRVGEEAAPPAARDGAPEQILDVAHAREDLEEDVL